MTFQQDIEKNETKYLHRFVNFADQSVLEIGSGEGRLTWQYADEARSVMGIDLDLNALRVATIDRSSNLQNKVSFARTDSTHIPCQNEQFDIAVLAWSF